MSEDNETEIDNASFEDTFWRDLLEASFRIKKEHRRLGKLLGSALKNNRQLLDGEATNPDGTPRVAAELLVLAYAMAVLDAVAEILRDSARKTGGNTTHGQGPASLKAAASPPGSAGESS